MLRKLCLALVVLLGVGSLGCQTPSGGSCAEGCCGGSCGVGASTPTPQSYAPAVQQAPPYGGGSGTR
jgi:hypothetical protein